MTFSKMTPSIITIINAMTLYAGCCAQCHYAEGHKTNTVSFC